MTQKRRREKYGSEKGKRYWDGRITLGVAYFWSISNHWRKKHTLCLCTNKHAFYYFPSCFLYRILNIEFSCQNGIAEKKGSIDTHHRNGFCWLFWIQIRWNFLVSKQIASHINISKLMFNHQSIWTNIY